MKSFVKSTSTSTTTTISTANGDDAAAFYGSLVGLPPSRSTSTATSTTSTTTTTTATTPDRFFCDLCAVFVDMCDSKEHFRTVLHNFEQSRTAPSMHLFVLEESRGFNLLRQQGWDGSSGLGKSLEGRLQPISTGEFARCFLHFHVESSMLVLQSFERIGVASVPNTSGPSAFRIFTGSA